MITSSHDIVVKKISDFVYKFHLTAALIPLLEMLRHFSGITENLMDFISPALSIFFHDDDFLKIKQTLSSKSGISAIINELEKGRK